MSPHIAKLIMLWLTGLAATSALPAAEIVLPSRVASLGSVVLLGDVATIRGDADEAELVERMKRVELFPAPSPGRARLLRQTELRELLLLHGIDPTKHALRGATATRIGPPRARAAVETPKPVAVSPVTPPVPPTPAELAPTERTVVVAARDLARGRTLTAQDLVLRTSEQLAYTPPDSALADPTLAVGQQLTRSLTAGRYLELAFLRRPVLVERGDLVTVVARAAGVQVKTTARAQDEGALGDLILLQTLEGRDRYPARVSGYRATEVYASGIVVSDPHASRTSAAGPPESPAPKGLPAARISRRNSP